MFTWTAAPLVLAHLLIGHKELRFLFPALMAAPLFLVQAWLTLGRAWKPLARTPRGLVWAAMGFNILALAVTTFVPAWTPVRFYQGLWDLKAHTGEPRVLYYSGCHPVESVGSKIWFYRPPGLELQKLSSFSELKRLISPTYIFEVAHEPHE